MDWHIAIPSYKRSEIIQSKTLAVLERYDIPPEQVTIFVASQEEYETYSDAIKGIQIIVALPGLAAARNFIMDYFPVGKRILFMDDDIEKFIERTDEGTKVELESFTEMVDMGFAKAKQVNCCLWGLSAVPNPFFMKRTISTHLKFIIGSCFGMINPGSSGDGGIHLDFSEKEDYLRTLLCYERDGAVVRINYVSPVTKYYKHGGGMQTNANRVKDQETAVEYLVDRWPLLVHINSRRRSQYPEVLLRGPRLKTQNR